MEAMGVVEGVDVVMDEEAGLVVGAWEAVEGFGFE